MPLALTRSPAASLAECELTYIDREPIDVTLARRQHAAYCAALRQAGAEVITLPALDDMPDSVFIEDAAVVFDEVAVLAAPGAASRQGETAALAPEVARHRPLARLEAPATLEGGDVLRVGRTVYVGRSARTNELGIAALAALIEPHGYRVVAVPVSGCLHLKTACTALDDHTLLANAAWADLSAFAGWRVVPVAAGEPFAANVLPVGDVCLMSAAAPETIRVVQTLGFGVCPVDISQFARAEGGLTCLSLILRQASEAEHGRKVG